MSHPDASTVAHPRAPGVASAPRWAWRSRRQIPLLVVAGLLLLYYAAVFVADRGDTAHVVDLRVSGGSVGAERVDVDAEVVELDPSEREMLLDVQLMPRGSVADADGGGFSQPMTVYAAASGHPPVELDFPADQAIDAFSVPLALDSGAYSYPFDRPEARVAIDVVAADTGTSVPTAVAVTNTASEWHMSGAATTTNKGLQLDLKGQRNTLVTSLSIFYLFAIGLTAIISVAVIGASLTDGEVTFSEVIWLGAMLVAIPAMRSEMPGSPPIGTAIDVFVFFPAVGIVALTLLAATVVLAVAKRAEMARDDLLGEDDG